MTKAEQGKPTMTAEKARAKRYREFLRELRDLEGENLRTQWGEGDRVPAGDEA
jgi:hypothetical protein